MSPAARLTDKSICPMVTGTVPHVEGVALLPGQTTVLIGGLPAWRVGDKLLCKAPPPDTIMKGSLTVKIVGKFAARKGDITQHGAIISSGFSKVKIGG